MADYIHQQVFSVAPGAAFLPAVVEALCAGKLVRDFVYSGDPLQLSGVSIYVPTRRAARELRSAFLDHLGGNTILLPHIRPLGEFDEDADIFEGDGSDAIAIPPPIDATERQLLLGALIGAWTKHLKIDIAEFYGDEVIETPVSTADAFWLARDLAALMDQFSTEQVPVSALTGFDDSQLPGWWKVTLAFLEIMRREWPAILEERGVIDPGEHRNLRLAAEARRLTRNPPPGPVIVAGSTGSIPATANLIAAVSRLPRGAVVLPGFDMSLDGASREILSSDSDAASVIGHPQYGLDRLVRRIGIAPGDISRLGGPLSQNLEARAKWVSESLRPADVTDRWMQTRNSITDDAFADVALLVAPNEHLEAAAIAAALREAVAEPQAMAALVTPDRNLARRVIGELARFSIEATDTGGTPASMTEQGGLLALILETVFNPGDPATLLGLLKHPLVALGAGREAHGRATDMLELLVLRGGAGRVDPARLSEFVGKRIANMTREDRRQPDIMSRLTTVDLADLTAFADRIESALAPLVELSDRDDDVPFASLVTVTVQVLEALCRDPEGFHAPLYAGESGETFRGFLSGLVSADVPLFMPSSGWPEAVHALMADLAVKPAPGGHPRIAIWGALEARLQTVDLMVLGGMNEGTWPSRTHDDQFLTRGMKTGLGLAQPERRIGLSAHDFEMAMGQKRVILARSERADGAPAIASRWVQRLTTFAGEAVTDSLRARGDRYVGFARQIQQPIGSAPASRPCPAPPLPARPKSISVSEVETLIRDPYALYARKVLSLKPLEDLVRDPGAAERGSLFHAIFETVIRENVDPLGADALDRIIEISGRLLDEEDLPADIRAVWWPRIEAAASEIARWEASRAGHVARRFEERSASRIEVVPTGVMLGGRADRLDRMTDGSIEIIDFKTGAPPTAKMVRALLAPQLPLEGALLRRGAFAEVGSSVAGAMTYVKVDTRGRIEILDVLKDGTDPADISERAWDRLTEMLSFYGEAKNGYQSLRLPQKARVARADYDHLARVYEWRDGDDDD